MTSLHIVGNLFLIVYTLAYGGAPWLNRVLFLGFKFDKHAVVRTHEWCGLRRPSCGCERMALTLTLLQLARALVPMF